MTPSAPRPVAGPPRHAWFKAALFALLAGNVTVYIATGTTTEAIDSVAWLVLLALFELETDFVWGAHGGWTAGAIRGARLLAAAAVAAAAVGYAREQEWLDVTNVALWIVMVIMLEARIRFPALDARLRTPLAVAAGVLYAGLGAVAVAWMWQGEWFDAYDALLWLAALVVVEMNILRRLAGRGV